MKKWIAAFFVLPFSCLHAQTFVNSFDNIRYWVGSGQNRAALVLQWNDGLTPVSVAWGYRWNGTATGIDMLRAIAGSIRITDPVGDPVGSNVGADNRLSLGLVDHGWGISVLSLEYQPSDGFIRTQSDWLSGYWEYFIRAGNFEYTNWGDQHPSSYAVPGSYQYSATEWFSAPIGAGERELVDGAWDAYSFALPSPGPDSGFISAIPVQPLAASLAVPTIGMRVDAREPTLTISTLSGIRYQLEFCDNLAGTWTELGHPITGDGSVWTIVDRTFADDPLRPMGSRFYRCKVYQ